MAESAVIPRIGCLWIGSELSFLERLCLSSMLRHGAQVTLYSYEPVAGLPDGVRTEDAASVVAWDPDLVHRKTGSPALMSDLFRYHLLKQQPGVLWCDTDIFMLRPLDPPTGHVFGFENDDRVNGAIAALPADDPALDALLEFSSNPYPVPPWFNAKQKARLRDTPMHVADMAWGTIGPIAFTHFLKTTGAISHAAAQAVYHPVPFSAVRDLIMERRHVGRWLSDQSQTVHLYGRATRRIVRERFQGLPPAEGWLGRQLEEYEIDPRAD